MIKKILITVDGDDVAPRFDLATEILMVIISTSGKIEEERTIILQGPSADKLCHLILKENIHTVICGAIEEEFYQFLKWKKIAVFDAIISPWQRAFDRFVANRLSAGDILYTRKIEGSNLQDI